MGIFHRGPACDEDACVAAPAGGGLTLGTLVSLAPFAATFAVVFLFVLRRVFPRLAVVQQQADDGADHYLPPSAPVALRQAHAAHGAQSLRQRLAAAAFASTTALAAVLAELILAEIAALVDPAARSLALHVTVPALLVLLVVLIPFLELQSILAGSGWSLQRRAGGGIPRVAWALQLLAFGAWLLLFWLLGRAVLGAAERGGSSTASRWPGGGQVPASSFGPARSLARACLERIGIIGISLMALLSGFASVSSPWQTFGQRRVGAQRRRAITDADVERKEASLMVTNDLLLTKRHRLRSLQRKMEAAEAAATAVAAGGGETAAPESRGGSGGGLFGKLVGSIKDMVGGASPEAAEIKSLEVEIAGLETMAAGLAAAAAQLRSRRTAEARAGTALGRVVAVSNTVFGVYCIFRVVATTATTVRRAWAPAEATFTTSDPVSRVLGLVAEHWDPTLDRGTWARQMSFLLSGALLAASANSVRQTCQLFVRWTPRGLLYQAQANLALVVGQIAATYVISAALLLRSNLPQEMGSAVGDALDSALESRFVERWFEGWFLVAVGATAVGIWIGRSLAAGDGPDGWDDFGLEEMGQKRS